MSTIQKIADIENEMARTQKNKATSYHVGLLKAKLAKLKREILGPSGGKGGKPGEGFDVTKCFGRGTRVLMFDGSVKRVEDLQKGDSVSAHSSAHSAIFELRIFPPHLSFVCCCHLR
jgi:ribosome-interacting GTPase 1